MESDPGRICSSLALHQTFAAGKWRKLMWTVFLYGLFMFNPYSPKIRPKQRQSKENLDTCYAMDGDIARRTSSSKHLGPPREATCNTIIIMRKSST